MTISMQNVLEKAVDLPPIERAELVEEILSSFNFSARSDIDSIWGQEVENRIDAYDRGEIASTPASNVFEKIEKKYSA